MNLKKYSWLAALPMIFTACQEDMLVENTPDQGITTLTASMDSGSDSRAQIVLNGTNTSEEFFHWNEGDEFTLFAGKNVGITPHVFTISSDYDDNAPAISADFTTSTALTDGQEFIAFYPSPVMSEEARSHVDLKINNTLLDNSEASWINYFKKNMFMMAQGTVANSLNIQFKHLCGIVRITYINTSSVARTIKGIYVDGSWGSGVGYSIWDELEITGGSDRGGRYGIDFENDVTIAANSSENFYILFMQNLEPEENKRRLTRVEIKLDNDNYKSTSEHSQTLPLFEVGKSYWLNVTDNGQEIFWTNDGANNPSKPEEDEPVIDTFDKLKNAINAPQQSEITSIRLASDITLTEQLVINKPIQLIMDGYTLTLGYTLQEKEGAIINNSDLYITKKGTIKAPSTGTEVDAYLIKSGAGKVDLRYVTIDAGIVKNAVYIKDGSGLVYETATINASGYTLDIESDSYSDVDIFTGTLNGDVRWKLNSAQYTKQCRFGAGPQSTINGDLVWAGEYGGKAEGYKIVFGSPVYIDGKNWPSQGGGQEPGGNPDGGMELDEATRKFYDDLHNPGITTIMLNKPITLSEYVDLGGKTVSITDNFFSVNTDVTAAISFVSNDSEAQFGFENGTIKGSSTETGKYLIESSIYCLQLSYGLNITAEGTLNGVHVTDKRCYVVEGVSISAENGHAIKMLADNGSFKLAMWNDVVVNGDVHLECNYARTDDSEYNSFAHLYKQDSENEGYNYAKINGNVIITGSQAEVVTVIQGDGEDGLNLISGEIIIKTKGNTGGKDFEFGQVW